MRGTVGDGDLYAVIPEVIKGGHVTDSALPRVEAGSNTSTVTLRVVGGDEKDVSKRRQ
jgi:hypothetical protein